MRTNSLSAWILAVRPYSLGNSVILVLVASAMAWTDGGFRPGPAVLCLAFALLMQCTANLVNDLWDFLKGADRPDRLGPDRAFAKGYITLPAMKAGIAMLPSDRKENSVVPDMSLLENMYLSEQVLSAARPIINKRREQERFDYYQKLLSIKANSSAESVLSLSGGNQQKVFMARWLNTDAELLLLDNPTQGIDVGAKAEIYHLILDLARDGKTVIINTLEIPELREVADVCYVLYEGRIVKRLEHDEIDEQTVMLYSTNSVSDDLPAGDNQPVGMNE